MKTTPTLIKNMVPALSVCSVLMANAAQAAPQPDSKPMLTVYTDAMGAQSLLAGHFETAIQHMTGGSAHSVADPNTNTNLCVAYVVTHHWDDAREACDRAVQQAQEPDLATSVGSAVDHDERLALALSNRAVMHWLEAQPQNAAADLAQAKSHAPRAKFVRQNETVMASADSTQTR